MGYPFEIMISSADGDFSQYKEYIEKNTKVTDLYEYRLYCIKSIGIAKALEGTAFDSGSMDGIEYVMSLSDYNRLREILGWEKENLQDDEILINCMKTATETFEKYIKNNNTIAILGKNVKIKEVKDENLGQVGFNGYIYTIIVPDSLLPQVKEEDESLRSGDDSEEGFYYFGSGYKLVAQTEETTDEAFYQGLSDFILKEEKQVSEEIDGEIQEYTIQIYLANVQTKGQRTAEAKSFYAIISFLAFYIALIFIMATATLLAIQQLSDSEKYKYRYELLKKLGIDELQMNRTILKQLFFYFAIPMIVPILVSIPAIISISQIFTVAVTIQEIWRNMAIILGMLVFVYGIYFIATNIQFDRNINGGK